MRHLQSQRDRSIMDMPASFWALSQSLLCRAQESILGPFMYDRQSATLRNGVVNWRLSH